MKMRISAFKYHESTFFLLPFQKIETSKFGFRKIFEVDIIIKGRKKFGQYSSKFIIHKNLLI